MGGTDCSNYVDCQKLQQQHLIIIPGLPDEIAMECLVRVPCEFHSNMKLVCQRWRCVISNPSFYRERQKSGNAEHLVCLVQALRVPAPLAPSAATDPHEPQNCDIKHNYNTITITTTKEGEKEQQVDDEKRQLHFYGLSIYNVTHHKWHRIMPNCCSSHESARGIGIPMFCHCVALPSSGKLLLLGGWDPITLESVPDVYILDFIGNKGWRKATPMSVARSFFACATVGHSTVYVAGGHDNQKNALRSAEVYDAVVDKWRMLPPMGEERDECHGLSWDGDSKFWVVSGYGTETQGQFRMDADCYDPTKGSWSRVDGVWPFPSVSPRATTTSVSVSVSVSNNSGRKYQWWWFVGGNQPQHQQENGRVREHDGHKNKLRWMVSSVAFPHGIIGSSPCVTTLGLGGDGGGGSNHNQQQHRRIFVMGSGGGGSSSSCGEFDREGGGGAFVLERDSRGNNYWEHIHTPAEFSGFPYSASCLLI